MEPLWKREMYKGYRVVYGKEHREDIPSWGLLTIGEDWEWVFCRAGFQTKEEAHKWIDEQKDKKPA